ncbi:fimbria/pilus outer membrane usher protein [Photobacterium carnosum]|uniref:fimbria/pilus outer membrane usher protein n=1 Tax=Photobacterium carnosum TaxID=2023717 RepID=UPI001E5E23ED|nr:fimbria/pilus outer membrane usher protein [Photobacterium carnosum]MCD9500321.1 fimbria/pilus outer membrane usher protein [Photobacterium carnosum]
MSIILLLVSLSQSESNSEYDLEAMKSLGGNENLFKIMTGSEIHGGSFYTVNINGDSYNKVSITHYNDILSNKDLLITLNKIVGYDNLSEKEKKDIVINIDIVTHEVNIVIPKEILDEFKRTKSIDTFIVNYRYNGYYDKKYSYNSYFDTKFIANGLSINNKFYLNKKNKKLQSSYIEYVSGKFNRHLIGDNYLRDSMFSGIPFIGYQMTPYNNKVKVIGGFKNKYYFASTPSLVQVIQNDKIIYSTETPPGRFYLPQLELNSSEKAYVRIYGNDGRIITYPYYIEETYNFSNKNWHSFAIGYTKNSNKYFSSYTYGEKPLTIGFLIGEDTANFAADFQWNKNTYSITTLNKLSVLNDIGIMSSSSISKKFKKDNNLSISYYLSKNYNVFDINSGQSNYLNLNYSGNISNIKTRYQLGFNHDFINSKNRYYVSAGRDFKYFNVFLSGNYIYDWDLSLNINIPLSRGKSLSSYTTYSDDLLSNNINYTDRYNQDIRYNIGATFNNNKKQDIYIKGTKTSNFTEITTRVLKRKHSYSYGLNLNGSILASKKGVHLTPNTISDTSSLINIENNSDYKIKGKGYTIGSKNKQIIKNIQPFNENKITIYTEDNNGNIKSSIYKTINPLFGNTYLTDFNITSSSLYIYKISINNEVPTFGSIITTPNGEYLGQIGLDGFFALEKKIENIKINFKNKSCNVKILNKNTNDINDINSNC